MRAGSWFARNNALIGKLFCVLIISISSFLFLYILRQDLQVSWGRDAKIYCLAGDAIRTNRNPYLTQELGSELSWNYLPVYAYGFRFLCNRLSFLTNYILFYPIIFLLSLDFWLEKKSWLYGLALCGTGLYSFGWNLKSGNFGIVEFFLLSASAWLLLRKANNWSFFLLGLTASLKIFPLLYFPLYFVMLRDKKERIAAALWGFIGFVLPFVASWLLNPDLMPWYFSQLLGLIPSQHSAISEKGGLNNPAFASMFSSLFSADGLAVMRLVFAFASLVLILLIVFYVYKRIQQNLVEEQKKELFFAFGMAAITLLLPRIKPYGFLPALLSIYLLTKNHGYWKQAGFLAAVTFIPLLAYYSLLERIDFNSLAPEFMKNAVFFVQQYHQPFFLFIVLLACVFSHFCSFAGPNSKSARLAK
jgi:hypothetical protein